MVFYLIGLGLGDAKDITVKGLEIVKSASKVYLEAYTSILTIGKEALPWFIEKKIHKLSERHSFIILHPAISPDERAVLPKLVKLFLNKPRLDVKFVEDFYGRSVILADRDLVEQGSDEILKGAASEDVAFLVVGDPFGATTHSDLVLRAKEENIPWKVIHNTSIMNAVGCCGLQLYNFGETVSIVFWTDTWKPDSFCEKINANLNRGLHTLCLLDIKMKEQTIENMMRGRKLYEPPRFMSVSVACKQLLEVARLKPESEFSSETLCVGLSRVGSEDQKIVAATLLELSEFEDMGKPLHSLIIVGKVHPLEQEYLNQFLLNKESCS